DGEEGSVRRAGGEGNAAGRQKPDAGHVAGGDLAAPQGHGGVNGPGAGEGAGVPADGGLHGTGGGHALYPEDAPPHEALGGKFRRPGEDQPRSLTAVDPQKKTGGSLGDRPADDERVAFLCPSLEAANPGVGSQDDWAGDLGAVGAIEDAAGQLDPPGEDHG